MSLSRWKMMAGVLGVSLGGLAAIAGQCPKTDTKAPPPPDLPVASSPAAAPALPPPAPASKSPDSFPSLPLPNSEPVKHPSAPVSSPPMLPVIPASGTLPAPPSAGPATPPAIPSSTPALPTPSDLPPPGKPTPPSTPPAPLDPPSTSSTLPPPGAGVPQPPADPLIGAPLPPTITKPAATGGVAGVTAVPQSKYRILLRVGEGEPTFEVRCGDDLMLKVVCEKVDIKSPEKGQGLSAVKASGKVRFAGFGAEGTCDELSFLAGIGEVGMTGNVKIQVKDKLGRIESELSTESMKYKIDPSAISGAMRP